MKCRTIDSFQEEKMTAEKVRKILKKAEEELKLLDVGLIYLSVYLKDKTNVYKSYTVEGWNS